MPATETVMRTAEVCARYGRRHVRHQLSAGRWQRPVRGVVVLHNGPLEQAESDQIALLGCAPGAVLGGLTALAYDGFTGVETDGVHVVLPEGADRGCPGTGSSRIGRRCSPMPTSTRSACHVGLGRSGVWSMRRVGRPGRQSAKLGRSSWPAYSRESLGHAIFAMPCRAEVRVAIAP